LPNDKVNTRFNGQCSEKEPFTSSGRQIWQIDKAFHPTMSSGEERQESLVGRKGPNVWSIAQLMMQKEACSGEMT